jgi:hypothetical protein
MAPLHAVALSSLLLLAGCGAAAAEDDTNAVGRAIQAATGPTGSAGVQSTPADPTHAAALKELATRIAARTAERPMTCAFRAPSAAAPTPGLRYALQVADVPDYQGPEDFFATFATGDVGNGTHEMMVTYIRYVDPELAVTHDQDGQHITYTFGGYYDDRLEVTRDGCAGERVSIAYEKLHGTEHVFEIACDPIRL